MKYKIIALFALILVMGAFLIPVEIYAASSEDTVPPVVTATVTGDMLNVSAKDDLSGVDALFINDRRVNYRVDSTVDLPLTEYAGAGEWISVYAVDFAGNISDTVTIQNPLYTTPEQNPEPMPEPDEGLTSGSGLRPFTPAGTGTVMDNPTDGDGKEFFTITTPDGNVFFLVIDRQRSVDDVYLLNAVTEQDLMALAESSGSSNVSAIPAELMPDSALEQTPEPTPEPEPIPANNGVSGSLIFIIIAVIAAGSAGYYFKIVRPRQQEPDDAEDYEDETDEDENKVYDDSDDDAGIHSANIEDDLIGFELMPGDQLRTEE